MVLAYIKLLALPVFAAEILASSLPQGISGWVNLAALATVIGGIFVVVRYKTALDVADLSGAAVEREANAERERADRIEAERVILRARVVALELQITAMPNLDQHALILEKLSTRLEAHETNMAEAMKDGRELNSQMVAVLKQIHAAVVKPGGSK